MNTRQLIYVLTLAKEKNFSRAAETLNITQPSLSQYIRKVEAETGAELFVRNGQVVGLTAAGEAYVDVGRRILDLEKHLNDRIGDLKEYREGKLTVGVSPYRSTSIMPEAVKAFRRSYPGVCVSLREYITSELKERASEGEFDLCVSTLPVDDELFEYRHMMSEEVLLAVNSNAAITQTMEAAAVLMEGRRLPAVDIRMMDSQDFVSLPGDQLLGKTLAELCAVNGISVRRAAESISVEAQHAMVAKGIGAALIPYSLVKNDTNDSIKYFSVIQQMPVRDIVVFYRRGVPLSAPAEAMLAILLELGRD